MSDPHLAEVSGLGPDLRKEVTTISDSDRNHAVASLITALDPGNKFKALKAGPGGQLEVELVAGRRKFTKFLVVTDADYSINNGLNYNSGSIGQVKAIISFDSTSVAGDMVLKTTFFYRIASQSKFVSHIREDLIQLDQNTINEFQ